MNILSCNNFLFLLSHMLLSCQVGDVMLYIHRCTCLRGYLDGTTTGLSKLWVWVVRHAQKSTMYVWCPVWTSLATESWEVDFFQSLYPRGNLPVRFYGKENMLDNILTKLSDITWRLHLCSLTLSTLIVFFFLFSYGRRAYCCWIFAGAV